MIFNKKCDLVSNSVTDKVIHRGAPLIKSRNNFEKTINSNTIPECKGIN